MTNRTAEIKTRLVILDAAAADPPPVGATIDLRGLPSFEDLESDLRYLLDHVSVLEEALRAWHEDPDFYIASIVMAKDGLYRCRFCKEVGKGRPRYRTGHAPDCIVLTLPAPEPVEAEQS